MAYVQPNTVVNILRHVPLEPDYQHTVKYSSLGAQVAAFNSFIKYSIPANTYQRVNKNTIRVGIVADNLYECNYMMFQNSAFGSKWFYAFITSVEYINNECTEITYEIDVMQTYQFDYSAGYCFVEREHSVHDYLGENYIPENIEIGDVILDDELFPVAELQQWAVFIATSHDSVRGKLLDGTFQGCDIYMFTINRQNPTPDETIIKNFLSNYTNTPEEIVAIWTAPSAGIQVEQGTRKVSSNSSSIIFKSYTQLTGTESFGNNDDNTPYIPKNKKLYTYPYNFFGLTNGMGDMLQLKYELFKNFTPKIRFINNVVQPVEVVAFPLGYKNSELANGLMSESIKISGYGVGSWQNDTWTQQMNTSARNLAGSLITGFSVGAMTGNPFLGAMVGGAHGLASVNSCFMKKDITPNVVYGSSNSGSALASKGLLNFYGARFRVTTHFAKCIDDYFSMYGYQTNRIKIPNVDSRPNWNYVKTGTCELIALSTMPCDDAEKIKSVFNKGVTFWKNIQNVGMYNMNNQPT